MSEWYIYIIRTRLNTLYTGITTDVERRFHEHSKQGTTGAKYLKGKGPLELVWHQLVDSKRDAARLEYRVKKLKKYQKLQLISGQIDLHSLRE
ncbi:GIY-YIG nuclease family protein [Marinomonas spartinae]|uniref:GIY-YIG nuclease family protein n=1 Tax=Marinomonas spartinae TaxID=1792290 RepID=UPI0018F1F56A|nr:GIY-YIG nuclease family protein [Marinomonas spartinae]MBJ7555662.1 GIY-YIG nuclease family protein [Marinomonas spartinae]